MENQPSLSARFIWDNSATYARVTGPYIAVAKPWTIRIAKSCSGVSTTPYMNGIPVKNVVPTRSQVRLPQRSDNKPIKGLNTIPVRVETATIKPRKISLAPRDAA